MELSSQQLHFASDPGEQPDAQGAPPTGPPEPRPARRHKRWQVARLREAMHTLYMLQHTAIEIFVSDGRSALLVFPSNKVCCV